MGRDRRDLDRLSMAGKARCDLAGHGMATVSHGKTGQGRRGGAGLHEARPGSARHGEASQKATQGAEGRDSFSPFCFW